MPLTLPNLDDRRWADLVEESRALIPVYGGEWTDHNVHDPGITLVELLAYLTEQDLFQLNQVPDSHKRRFLSLVGLTSLHAEPAVTVLALGLATNAADFVLPSAIGFTTSTPNAARFQTLEAITVHGGDLVALQVDPGSGFVDLSQAWRRGEDVNPFGADPEPGAIFYLGFSQPLSVGQEVKLYFAFDSDKSSRAERHRILEECLARELDCKSSQPPNPCRETAKQNGNSGTPPSQLPHPSVRISWEFWADTPSGGSWQGLGTLGDLSDSTRSFTLNGTLRFKTPSAMRVTTLGSVSQPLYYVRARFVTGCYDAVPAIKALIFNAAVALQLAPESSKLRIAPGATIQGTRPAPGDSIKLSVALDTVGRIQRLVINPNDPLAPQFLVLAYADPGAGTGASDGLLQLEAVFLGKTSGLPSEQFDLPVAPVLSDGFRLFLESGTAWSEWQAKDDFEASSPADTHFVLEETSARIIFGDGRNGLVPDTGSLVFAVGASSDGSAGNLRPNTVNRLEDSLHNRAILGGNWTVVRASLHSIANPLPSWGGTSEETVDQASLRAIAMLQQPTRTVTANDYSQLALDTPGVQLARAFVVPDFHDHFPCFRAPGIVTVVILPELPVGKPFPCPATRTAVLAYLNRRRILGTRIRVVGPQYVNVSLSVRVKAVRGADPSEVKSRLLKRLREFLDPLKGGERGDGWPFGRHVHRVDLLSVAAQVQGVDYVLDLSFTDTGCAPSCTEICVPRTGLPFAGTFEVKVS